MDTFTLTNGGMITCINDTGDYVRKSDYDALQTELSSIRAFVQPTPGQTILDALRADRKESNRAFADLSFMEDRLACFRGEVDGLKKQLAAEKKAHENSVLSACANEKRLSSELSTARETIERLHSVICYQGRKDTISEQIEGAPFDEDLDQKHRMEAGHA